MSEPSPRNRTLLDAPDRGAAVRGHRPPGRGTAARGIGRLALLAADTWPWPGALAAGRRCSPTPASRAWVPALIPLYALLTKMAGLYDRDQFVLQQDDARRGAGARGRHRDLRARSIEGGRALDFTGRSHPFLMWGLLTGALIVARAAARFLVVRTTPAERVLVIGDAATTAMVEQKIAADPGLNAEVVGRLPARAGLRRGRRRHRCSEPSRTCRRSSRSTGRRGRSWPRRGRARTSPT